LPKKEGKWNIKKDVLQKMRMVFARVAIFNNSSKTEIDFTESLFQKWAGAPQS